MDIKLHHWSQEDHKEKTILNRQYECLNPIKHYFKIIVLKDLVYGFAYGESMTFHWDQITILLNQFYLFWLKVFLNKFTKLEVMATRC